jgi:hypothetical protein
MVSDLHDRVYRVHGIGIDLRRSPPFCARRPFTADGVQRAEAGLFLKTSDGSLGADDMTNRMSGKQSAIVLAALGAVVLTGCGHRQAVSTSGRVGTAPSDPQLRATALAKLQAQSQAASQATGAARDQQRAAALARLQSQSH